MKIYCNKSSLQDVLASISRSQTKKKRFINVTVKPYTGKKYGNDYVVINVG